MSILLLLSIGLGFYAQQFSNQNLYEETYSPVGDYITNMDDDLSDMENAMKFFNNRKFDTAEQLFHKIYGTTRDQAALFYLGQSQYEAHKFEQSIRSLSRVTSNYQPEARWYMALAYLKLEDENNMQKTLDMIIASGDDEAFTLKAKRLKRKIKSPLRRLVL